MTTPTPPAIPTLKVSKDDAAKIRRFAAIKVALSELKKEEDQIKTELLLLADQKEAVFQFTERAQVVVLGRIYQDFWKGLDQKRLWADYPKEAANCKISKPYLAIEVF